MKIKLASDLRNFYATALSTTVNTSHPQGFRFSWKIPIETYSKKMPHVAILKSSKFLFGRNPSKFRKKTQILIGLRTLFQSHSTAKLLHFSETVNPSSDVNRNADVGVNAIGHHQEKNALFLEEDFPFISSLKNLTQKKSENSSRTKLCSGNQRKDHFRLESVKWRAACRKCHHIKRFRQMKEKRY